MSARHSGSISTNQKQSIQDIRTNYYEGAKTLSLQSIAAPQTFSLLSHGPTSNAGTTHPVLYPFLIISPTGIMDIDLSGTYARYSNISLTSDDTTINFTNLVQNRITKFTLDITINTATFNSLTFNPTIENLPTLPTILGTRYLLEITAYKTATEETYFVTAGTLASGGGGISFPEDFPEEPDRGVVLVDQIIDFAQSERHSIAMTVGVATISLDIQNEPTDKVALSSITMKQDNTGGRTFTFLDSVGNSQTIIDAFNALAANESISFMLEWERGVFTVYLKTGNIVTGGSAFSGNLSDLVINVNKDWLAQGASNFGSLTGVTALDMAGETATIQFLANINFIETNQFINSLGTGIDYKVDALQDHTFRSVNGDFLALTETNATDRRLDIKQNRETNIGKLMFSPTFDLDTVATAEIYESTTFGNLRYVSNNAHEFVQEGVPTLLSIGNFAEQGGLIQDIAILNFNSLTGEFMVNNGDFQLDGINMKVKTGNGIKNLSEIGSPLTTKGDLFGFDTVDARIPVGTNGQVLTANSAVSLGVEWAASAAAGANTALSNLDLITAINSNEFIPATDGTQNLGGISNRWANIYGGRMVFPSGIPINGSEANIVKNTSNDMQFNVTTGNTFDWTFEGGVVQMRLSSTELELLGVNLDLENNNIFDVDQMQITGSSGDVVHGFLSGSTGILNISADETASKIRMITRDGGGISQTVADFNFASGSAIMNFQTLGILDNVGLVRFGTVDQPTILLSGSSSLQYSVIGIADIHEFNGRVEFNDDVVLGDTNLDGISINGTVNTSLLMGNGDIIFDTTNTVNFAGNQETVGGAGASANTPNSPEIYAIVKLGGIEYVLPLYLKS